MDFGHKYVETGPNCSHDLATCHKCHKPLSNVKQLEIWMNSEIVKVFPMKNETPQTPPDSVLQSNASYSII